MCLILTFGFCRGQRMAPFGSPFMIRLFTYPLGRVCLCFHPIHIDKFSLWILGALAFSGQAVQILQKTIWWIRPRGVGQEEAIMKGWDDLAGFHYVGAKLQMGFQLAVCQWHSALNLVPGTLGAQKSYCDLMNENKMFPPPPGTVVNKSSSLVRRTGGGEGAPVLVGAEAHSSFQYIPGFPCTCYLLMHWAFHLLCFGMWSGIQGQMYQQ